MFNNKVFVLYKPLKIMSFFKKLTAFQKHADSQETLQRLCKNFDYSWLRQLVFKHRVHVIVCDASFVREDNERERSCERGCCPRRHVDARRESEKGARERCEKGSVRAKEGKRRFSHALYLCWTSSSGAR